MPLVPLVAGASSGVGHMADFGSESDVVCDGVGDLVPWFEERALFLEDEWVQIVVRSAAVSQTVVYRG